MNWNDGYVSNIDYPAAFFREQSPTHLSFACVLNGYEPVPLDGHFTYMELGAGQGLTANILAASHPRGEFYAVDFSPSQVAASRQLSSAAQLHNLTLLENSFAELAAGKVALPQLDFITMYGVYSWVDADNRRHIADFINRYLKPGGIVYLNYNAMPGWTMRSATAIRVRNRSSMCARWSAAWSTAAPIFSRAIRTCNTASTR
jgi:SAM-dependent methyltransferase